MDSEDQTQALMLTNQALYQQSHLPCPGLYFKNKKKMKVTNEVERKKIKIIRESGKNEEGKKARVLDAGDQ